jgi:hypothetical protein
MNFAYNGSIALILLALVMLPVLLGAYLKAPEIGDGEEFDYR